MARKKVEPGYEVIKDNKPKPPKFPVHENDEPMDQTILDDGQVVYTPTDPFCSVKVKGFFNSDTMYAWEVVARRWEKLDLVQWGKSKKWETVGYISPYTYQMQFLANSKFINSNIGPLVKDIQEYESIMKERIRKGEV